MPQHMLQSSFNGGEVSPRLFGRTDVALYDVALGEMTNFAPTVEGPAIKRSGSIIADIADPTATTLIPFEFNSTQAYVLDRHVQRMQLTDAQRALEPSVTAWP